MKCEEKRKLNSIKQAIQARDKLHKRGLINIRFYPCNICGKYHLTHKPDKFLKNVDK